jgi:8-amino-7-oxononanoate synthase
LLPSSFHLFWDLLGVLSREPIEIFMDASTYPIARWGAEHWAAKGVPLQTFARHDAACLAQLLGRRGSGRPVVLSDGVCPGSNSQPAIGGLRRAGTPAWWLLADRRHPGPGHLRPSPLRRLQLTGSTAAARCSDTASLATI